MLKVVFAVMLAAVSVPAIAGDKLLRGAFPEWVKPLIIAPHPIVDGDGLPARILLEDNQLRLGPDGQSEFVQTLTQIRNPMGLAAAGATTLAWSPDIDTLTVHHVRVLRGSKVIDILASQDFTVIRRETNLEDDMLDGVLSATLQPEGIQAGDVIDIAYTRRRLDPAMQGRAEDTIQARSYGRADRVRLRAIWDTGREIAWTAGSGLDTPKVTKAAGRTELTVDMKDVESVKFPRGAPARYYPTRDLIVSEFKTWADVAALATPYYEQAAQLKADSPLRAEIERIRKASPDPKARADLALQLVEDQIRYLAVTLENGGYVPATPEATWQRRFGDCKAKSVLLIALLRELGIEAEAALVNSSGSARLTTRPPGMTAFDHVIVRATIGGKVYWLDGTRSGDRDIGLLGVPSVGHALPLRTSGATLVALIPPPLERPDRGMTLRIDASKGLDAPAPVRAEMILGGDMGHYMRLYSSTVPVAEREKILKQAFSVYPGIEPKSVTMTTDPASGQPKLVMDGVAKVTWTPKSNGPRWLLVSSAALGGGGTLKREPGPLADAPWAVPGYPSWVSTRFEMVLPAEGEGFRIDGADVDTTVAGRVYRRSSRIEKGVATIETSVRTVAEEYPNSEAEAAAETLKEMAKVRVGIRSPSYYYPSEDDVAAWATETPKTADDYIGRGVRYSVVAQYERAIADYDKAIELNPKAAYAWANRAIAHDQVHKPDLAAADVAKALELDPRNYVAVQHQARLAMRERRYADAAMAYARAADLVRGNAFALRSQAQALWLLGDGDKALAVLVEAEKAEPGDVAVRSARRHIFEARGHRDLALAEIDAAVTKNANDRQLHLERAALLQRMGRQSEADAAYERAIAIQPDRVPYLTRLYHRHPADLTGRMADLELAEKAGSEPIPVLRAGILGDAGRFDEALAAIDGALKRKPDDHALGVERAEILLRAGRVAEAGRAIRRLRSQAAGNASRLNELCWMGATRNHDLTAALGDCDAALRIDPDNGPTADSRGLVLVRLNRPKEAIDAYNLALGWMPTNPESIYGRGLAQLQLGNLAAAEADFAAARVEAPYIDLTFEGYGLGRRQSERPKAGTPDVSKKS